MLYEPYYEPYYTERALKVMQFANQEAHRFNHEYIGTEHILLGLVKEGSGIAANVLKNMGIDLQKVRNEVEKVVRSGPELVNMGRLPQTPRAKRVVEYSIEETRTLGHDYIGTEHILLGLLREQDGIVAQVLMNLGLRLEDTRREVLNLLGCAYPSQSKCSIREIFGKGENHNTSKYFRAAKNDETTILTRMECSEKYAAMLKDENTSVVFLHNIAKEGNIGELAILLEAGVNIESRDDSGRTPLFYAVRSNRVEIVKELLENGANVNAHDNEGKTSLHVAAKGSSSHIVTLLIEAGVDIAWKDNAGNSALYVAERHNRTKTARLLREAKIEVKRKSIPLNDMNVIARAAEHGNIEAVKVLLARGANVNNIISGGGTPLHIAADKNDPGMVAILIEAGANVNMKDYDGETPLHRAALHNSESVALLIKAGAKVDIFDNRNDSPLHYAAESDATQSITALIDAGATVNFVGYGGRTPIFDAIRWNNLEAVKLLLARGADVNFRINLPRSISHGESPIHTAAQYANVEIMAVLLGAGADIEAHREGGKKAMDYAICEKKPEMIQFLDEHGATIPDLLDYSSSKDSWAKAERWYKNVKKSDETCDETATDHLELLCRAIRQGKAEMVTLLIHKRRTNVNALDKHGYSPLHWAALEGNIEIVKVLLDNGADRELQSNKGGNLPLLFAVWRFILNGKRNAKCLPIERDATFDTMLFLLEREANVNGINGAGASLLHIAAQNNVVELVGVLLDNGADIELCDKKGRTPLHYAALNRSMRAMTALLKAGANRSATDNKGYTPQDYAGNAGTHMPQKRH